MSSGCGAATMVAVLLLPLVSATSAAEPSGDRLPRDTEPLAYGLRLLPAYDQSADRYSFAGHVEILIRANEITSDVTLHARDLDVRNVGIVEAETQTAVDVEGFRLQGATERLLIHTGQSLLAGRQYQVEIGFQGLLRTDMTGFYRSLYKEDGESRCVLFAAVVARTEIGSLRSVCVQIGDREGQRLLFTHEVQICFLTFQPGQN